MPGLTNRRGDRPTVVVDTPYHFHHSNVAISSLTGAAAVPAASVPRSMPVRDSLLERGGATRRAVEEKETQMITLSGGSLGSCVDEERSQLRELM
jgi:hypothetical protein